MCSSSKVFIFNNQYVADECAHDVGTFLRDSKVVFAETPDVIEFNAPFNADGLKCPTFVVPGGSMLTMSDGVLDVFTAVRSSTVREDFNYIGSCAGAFLGAGNMEVFSRSPYYQHFVSSDRSGLSLIDDYCAIGAFCPVPTDKMNPATKGEIPYSVQLNMPGFLKPTQQLLVNGPGFFALKDHDPSGPQSDTEVVAYYADKETYDMKFDTRVVSKQRRDQQYHQFMFHQRRLPAMLSRKPTETRGGVFLSGTHFYACVENSELLAAFETTSKEAAALPKDAFSGLKDLKERENTRIAVETLLRRTLK